MRPVVQKMWAATFALSLATACSEHRTEPAPAIAPSIERASEPSGGMTPALRASYIAATQKEHAAEHRLERTAEGFRATAARGLRADFGARGATVSAARDDAAWRWAPSAARFGCDGELEAVEPTAPEAEENRATYRRRGFDEWYVAGPLGIEQGFTLAAAPACRSGGGGKVVIELAGGDGLAAVARPDGTEAALRDRAGRDVLWYTDLYVVDATGKGLPAELRADGERVAIAFDDTGATYPVIVDPLIQQATLTASDGESGASVSVDGNTAIVGAPDNEAAYVFVRSGYAWTQQAKLTHDGTRDFGCSVSVSGDTVLVGTNRSPGAAYVFVRSNGTWSEQQNLTVGGSSYFGSSVAVSGDTAIVGDSYASSYQGAAYIFVRTGGVWSQQQKLTASDATTSAYFGSSVSLAGDTAVVGAYKQNAAYAFVRSGNTWTEQKLVPDDKTPSYFGYSVAVSGDTAIVGAYVYSAPYVFVRSGGMWSQQQKLGDANYSYSVSVSGNRAVVGTGNYNGIQVFTRSGTTWSLQQKLDVSSASVSVSQDTVVVGTGYGGAYVFAPAKPNGATCASGDDCDSGFCADGVCCNTACDAGGCDACSVAAGATIDGTCKPFTGATCDDGDVCTMNDTCQAGVCVGAAVTCTAIDQCHLAGTCDRVTGSCTNPPKQDGLACDDGSVCTKTDWCQAGVCVGSNAKTCTASDQCHDVGTCDPTTGECSNPAKADGSACNDGVACTKGDACTGGVCGGTAYTCTAGDCDASSTCDGNGGCAIVKKGSGAPCTDDDNPCTSDLCDSAGLCAHATLADGTSCIGGLQCEDGSCGPKCQIDGQLYPAYTANPSNACERCMSTITTIAWSPREDGKACDDGDVCTQTDTCQAGVCTGAEPLSCAASECSTAVGCDPVDGCQYAPSPAGTVCRAASCVDGAGQPEVTCDGATTACPATTPVDCGLFACAEGACLTTCSADADCASGYRCVAGGCVDAGDGGAGGGIDAGVDTTTDAGADSAADAGRESGTGAGSDKRRGVATAGDDGGSCGCRVAGAQGNARSVAGLVAVTVAAAFARRRRSAHA